MILIILLIILTANILFLTVFFIMYLSRQDCKVVNYVSQAGVNKSIPTKEQEQQQVADIQARFDMQAANRSASNNENIEMHNSDNLGDDVIIADDCPETLK
jgi:hypothetical protein